MHVVAVHTGFKVIEFLWINFGCYLQEFELIAQALVAICKGFKAIARLADMDEGFQQY